MVVRGTIFPVVLGEWTSLSRWCCHLDWHALNVFYNGSGTRVSHSEHLYLSTRAMGMGVDKLRVWFCSWSTLRRVRDWFSAMSVCICHAYEHVTDALHMRTVVRIGNSYTHYFVWIAQRYLWRSISFHKQAYTKRSANANTCYIMQADQIELSLWLFHCTI